MSRLYTGTQQNDFNTNFEVYMSKLMRKKPNLQDVKAKVVTRDKTNRSTASSQANNRQINNNARINPNLVVPYINTEENILHLSDDELVHKEIINNKMAQVEVTVRTVSSRNRSRSNSVSTEKREPWSKLLQNKKSSESLAPSNYDYGLATIHFLSKELQQKLKCTPQGDPTLQQIVNDIQHTLGRINPGLSKNDEDEISQKNASCEANFNGKTNKKLKVHQSMQTVNIGDTEKNVPAKKYDNDELERQLQKERETIKKLEQILNERNDQTATIKKLREERELLEKKLKESQNDEKKFETQSLIQQLRNDNTNIEYDNMNLKHEMTILRLEKEKMVFLLESRDKQIKALKNEIEAIQSLVCSQLFDLKGSDFYSTASLSRTSIASKNFPKLTKAKQVQDLFLNKMKNSFASSSTVDNENSLRKKDTRSTIKTDYQDEFPQRDVPSTTNPQSEQQLPKAFSSDFSALSEVPDVMKDDLENNIKEMFDELKRQAMVMTLDNPSNNQIQGMQSVN